MSLHTISTQYYFIKYFLPRISKTKTHSFSFKIGSRNWDIFLEIKISFSLTYNFTKKWIPLLVFFMVYFLRTGPWRNISDWLLAYKAFFYFKNTWRLFSHVGCIPTQEEMPGKGRIQKEKEKAKNVAVKESRTITSLFPRASTASTLSSPDQLIEDEIKYLYLLKHFLLYSYRITQYKPWFVFISRKIYNLSFWKTWTLILLELRLWESFECFSWSLIYSFFYKLLTKLFNLTKTTYKVIEFKYFFKKAQLRQRKARTIVCISFFKISTQVRIFMWKASVWKR